MINFVEIRGISGSFVIPDWKVERVNKDAVIVREEDGGLGYVGICELEYDRLVEELTINIPIVIVDPDDGDTGNGDDGHGDPPPDGEEPDDGTQVETMSLVVDDKGYHMFVARWNKGGNTGIPKPDFENYPAANSEVPDRIRLPEKGELIHVYVHPPALINPKDAEYPPNPSGIFKGDGQDEVFEVAPNDKFPPGVRLFVHVDRVAN